MALDASIILAGANNGRIDASPLTNALFQYGQQKRQDELQPMRNRLLEAQVSQAEQAPKAAQQKKLMEFMPVVAQHVQGLAKLPMEQRQIAHAQFEAQARQMGIPVDDTPDDLSDQGLQTLLAATQSYINKDPSLDLRRDELDLRRNQMGMQQKQFDREMGLREREIDSRQRSGLELPAAQREAEWYMSLPPEKKAEVDRYRRGDRVAVGTEDKIYKTAVAAEESRQRAVNYEDLANRYEQSDIGAGMFGSSLPEAVKELTGSQDGYTAMRKDWASIKASQVVSNLPPGAASDADVKLALGGFLPDNANPKQVASFMRGIAKLERVKADYESFKSDYMSENKSPVGLNKAWKVYAKQQGIGGPTISSANQQPATAKQQGGPVQIQSDDDYNSLPSGAEFIAPDGSRRRKP